MRWQRCDCLSNRFDALLTLQVVDWVFCFTDRHPCEARTCLFLFQIGTPGHHSSPVRRQIRGNSQQPGSEFCFVSISTQVLVSPYKDLLSHIFGIIANRHHLVAESVDHGSVALKKLLKCGKIAISSESNEGDVGIGWPGNIKPRHGNCHAHIHLELPLLVFMQGFDVLIHLTLRRIRTFVRFGTSYSRPADPSSPGRYFLTPGFNFRTVMLYGLNCILSFRGMESAWLVGCRLPNPVLAASSCSIP